MLITAMVQVRPVEAIPEAAVSGRAAFMARVGYLPGNVSVRITFDIMEWEQVGVNTNPDTSVGLTLWQEAALAEDVKAFILETGVVPWSLPRERAAAVLLKARAAESLRVTAEEAARAAAPVAVAEPPVAVAEAVSAG
jgi:hypothetical protein